MLSHTLSHAAETDAISVRLRWFPNPGFVTDFSHKIMTFPRDSVSRSAYSHPRQLSESSFGPKRSRVLRDSSWIASFHGLFAIPRRTPCLTNHSFIRFHRLQRNLKFHAAPFTDLLAKANWSRSQCVVAAECVDPLLCATSMRFSVSTVKAR
jgi:hypothetical protein